MSRRSKWVVNCWLAAALLLSGLALYWLAIWLLPPANPRNSHLGRAYDQIDSTTTLATVQVMVGRPPHKSPRPPATAVSFVQEMYVFPLPEESDEAAWREDKSLVVSYSTKPDGRILSKHFYVDPDLSKYDATAGWRRLTKWFRKIFR